MIDKYEALLEEIPIRADNSIPCELMTSVAKYMLDDEITSLDVYGMLADIEFTLCQYYDDDCKMIRLEGVIVRYGVEYTTTIEALKHSLDEPFNGCRRYTYKKRDVDHHLYV